MTHQRGEIKRCIFQKGERTGVATNVYLRKRWKKTNGACIMWYQSTLELVGLGSSSSTDSFASWKMNVSRMEKDERVEMPLQGEDESRRSSPPQEAMDKSLEEEKDE